MLTKISNLGNPNDTKLNQNTKYAYDKVHRAFDELQVAREALRRCCEEFSAESRMSKKKANEKMQQYLESNIEDVVAMVYGLESEWRQRHSNVS